MCGGLVTEASCAFFTGTCQASASSGLFSRCFSSSGGALISCPGDISLVPGSWRWRMRMREPGKGISGLGIQTSRPLSARASGGKEPLQFGVFSSGVGGLSDCRLEGAGRPGVSQLLLQIFQASSVSNSRLTLAFQSSCTSQSGGFSGFRQALPPAHPATPPQHTQRLLSSGKSLAVVPPPPFCLCAL